MRRLALRTLGAALLVIVLATAVLTILDYAVEQKVEELKENELKNESVSRMVSNFGIAESWLRGFLLKPVSGALSQTVTWLTLAEHRYTRTDFEQSLFSKVALVIVLNEALSSLFMAGPMSEWYGDHDDSVMTSQLAVVLIGLTPALITLVQPDVLWRRYVKARAAKTQEKMDQLWEPQPFGLGDAYAGMTTTTALGLIFGPAMPIVYPITALALALQYFANKYALLRVHSKPPMLGGGLSEIFTRYLAILIGCSLCLQVFLYGGYDYFSWKDVQYLHAAVEGAAAGQHVSRVLAPPDMPVYGLLALLLYTLVPVTVLPCFRCAPRDAASAHPVPPPEFVRPISLWSRLCIVWLAYARASMRPSAERPMRCAYSTADALSLLRRPLGVFHCQTRTFGTAGDSWTCARVTRTARSIRRRRTSKGARTHAVRILVRIRPAFART